MGQKVHIIFNRKDIPKNGEDYFLFPRSSVDTFESSFQINFDMFPPWTKVLADSMKHEFSKISADQNYLLWSINNLFFWRYLHYFRFISLIREKLKALEVEEIVIHGSLVKNYKIVTNKGDEGRTILYRPEYEVPYFVEQVLGKEYKLSFKNKVFKIILVQLEKIIRSYVIFFIKLIILLLVKTFRSFFPTKIKHSKQAEAVFIARSLGSAEQFKRYSKELSLQGIEADILLDLNLHQAFRVFPQNTYQTHDELVSFYDIFLLAVKLLCKSLINSSQPIQIQNGEFNLKDDVGNYSRELNLSLIDLHVHRIKLSRYLKKTGAKVIINGEGISPYIFLYDDLSKKMGLKSFRVQTFPFSVNDGIDFCFSDGIFLDSQKLVVDFSQRFPLDSNKINYLGDFDLITFPEKRIFLDGAKIVYFTQFHESHLSHQLVKSLIAFSKKSMIQVDIYIKPHPRDQADYSIYPEVSIFPKDKSVDECMKSATLVIGRSTSVLNRAFLFGIPYVVCQLSDADRYIYAPFVDPKLNVTVPSIDEFDKIMKNLPHYIDQYYRNRADFVRLNFKVFDLEKFRQLLKA